MRTIPVSSQKMILATLIIVSLPHLHASAREEKDIDIANKVEINTNAVGCSDFKLLSAVANRNKIKTRIRISSISENDPGIASDRRKSAYPCVCGRSERYFYSVYPRGDAARPETVWMTGQRSFVKNFPFGRFSVHDKDGRIVEAPFPFFKTKNNRPFSHYYLVFGCHNVE